MTINDTGLAAPIEPDRSARAGGGSGRYSRANYLVIALCIALLSTALNFGGVFGAEVIDDRQLLHLHDERGCGRNPIDCFRHPLFGLYYRPLVSMTFSIGENLWGVKSPVPYHVENLALHFAVVLLALYVFRDMFARDRAAILSGLLYGLHPLHVPVTTFVGGRTDTLAMLFALLYLIGLPRSEGENAIWWRIVSVTGFAGAIFTKEQCMLLLLLAPFCIGQHKQRAGGPPKFRPKAWMAGYLVVAAAFLIGARRVIPPGAIDVVAWRATARSVEWSAGLRVEMVGRTLWYYCRCFFWPTPIVLHRCSLGPWDTPQPFAALGGFFAGGVLTAVIIHSRHRRPNRFMALWLALTLLPCLNIYTIPSQFLACFRAAIPLFGFAGLFGALWDVSITAYWSTSAAAVLILPFAICGLLAGASVADVLVWHNQISYAAAETRSDPNFLVGPMKYAVALRWYGDTRGSYEVHRVIIARLFPDTDTPQQRIALLDTPQMMRRVKSMSSLRYQVRQLINYEFRETGGVEQDLGLYGEAIAEYRVALAADPTDDEVSEALVYCLRTSGRFEEAATAQELYVRRADRSRQWRLLGELRFHLKQWRLANSAFTHAILLCEKEGRSSTELSMLKQCAEWELQKAGRSH